MTVLNLNLNKMHQNIKIKFYRKLSLLNISRLASIVHHHTLTIVILFRTCNYKGQLLLKMFGIGLSWLYAIVGLISLFIVILLIVHIFEKHKHNWGYRTTHKQTNDVNIATIILLSTYTIWITKRTHFINKQHLYCHSS